MKRFIKISCLCSLFLVALLFFDKLYYNPEKLYLAGNKYLVAGEYKKAERAYVGALNSGGDENAFGGLLAAHYKLYGWESTYRIFNSRRPEGLSRDDAQRLWDIHTAMEGYKAVIIEKSEGDKYYFYDENHKLKGVEEYERLARLVSATYDDNGNIVQRIEKSSVTFGQNITDYYYENNLLVKEEITYDKSQSWYERREDVLYFYDEKGNLTEKHHKKYESNYSDSNTLTVRIYNLADYPLAVKYVSADGSGKISYYSDETYKSLKKIEYYDTRWNMTYYILYKWMETPEECGEYRSMGFNELWTVHEQKKYSPDGTYIGKFIDIHNGMGSWRGMASFDEKDNLIEYMTKGQYMLQAQNG